MKFWLVSDNHDTLTGMRLSGIEGVLAESADEVKAALLIAMEDTEIGIILITEKLSAECPSLIKDLKLNRARPLIVEIPDRHAEGRSKDSISRYISEAIGVKI